MINFIERFLSFLPATTRETLFLRLWAYWNVRMISYLKPRVIETNAERMRVLIPLNRRSRNHLHSMYFGVLAAGADIAGGVVAMRAIQENGGKVNLVFKDFHADFLKRAEGDVVFTSLDGPSMKTAVKQAMDSGERVNAPVHITATVPSKLGDEPVAQFTLTISMKRRTPRGQ